MQDASPTPVPALPAALRAPARRRALLLAVALLAAPGAAAAQEAGAGLRVLVTDSATHEPVARAQVTLLGGRRGLTGADGSLVLGVAPGAWAVKVAQLGYTLRRVMVRVSGEMVTEVAVVLAPDPVALERVGVTGRAGPRTQHLRSFYARAGSGSGQYITRAQIERANPREISDLFHMVPGMVVQSGYTGDRPRMEGGEVVVGVGGSIRDGARGRQAPGGRRDSCPILYFIDGSPIEAPGGVIDGELDPAEVEGIEIYRRGTQAPAQFRRTDNCGIILIWKRESLEPRPRPSAENRS